VKEIFEYINAPIEWEQYDVSGMSSAGEALFIRAMDSLKRNKVGLKGISNLLAILISTNIHTGILFTPISQSGHISWNVAMRQQLDIYASIVLCKSLPGFPTRHSNVDFAIIRENTEGEYSGLEHQSYPGVVESLKVSTRAKAERISRFAFDFALKNNRKVRFNGKQYVLYAQNKIVLESDMCAQSQHYEARRWLVPEYFPKGRRRLPVFRHRIQ
jgi:isocitrate dehydrogenase (NAD+)